MGENKPLITVIVPVYNIAKYLPRLFDSLDKQTFKNYELLLIDDESSDNSLEVCKNYAKNDTRVRVIPLKHVGLAGVRNYSMGCISAPFTVFIDGDDYVEPNYLKNFIEAQQKYDADLVVCRVSYILEDGTKTGATPSRGEMFFEKSGFYESLPMLVEDRRLNYAWGKLFRSEIIRNLKVDANMSTLEDTRLNCLYLKHTNRIVITDYMDYNYIKYTSRSITSNCGIKTYNNVCIVNKYLTDTMAELNYLSPKMQEVIDSRVLLSAVWMLEGMDLQNASRETLEQVTQILNHPSYLEAYKRYKVKKKKCGFIPIKPQTGEKYISGQNKFKIKQQRKARILSKTPRCIVAIYRKLKKG